MRHLFVLSLAAGALAACEDEPAPMRAQATYSTCQGRPGTCGNGDCCRNETPHLLSGTPAELNLDCEVRQGAGDSYRIEFSIEDEGTDAGILGDGLEWQSTASNYSVVRNCTQFVLTDEGNDFPTPVCDNVNRPPGQAGGCEIGLFIDAQDQVQGQFECKELPLPGDATTVVSTIYRSGLGSGQFTIQNCRFRL
jgi:hypothetical protein